MRAALKAFALGFGIGLLLIIISMFVISYVYRDRLAGFLLEKINENIETKVDIKQIDFTLLKKFPNASLELTDVIIYSSNKYKFESTYVNDTLLYAKKLYLQFNIFNLLNNKFIISKIHLDQATINLLVNQYGQANYDIVKKSKSKKESISIDLKDVKITRTNVCFYNEIKNLLFVFESYNSRIQGNLAEDNYTFNLSSDLFINILQSEEIKIIRNSPAQLDIDIDVTGNKYNVNKGELKFNNQYFALSGNIKNDKDMLISVNMEGSNLNIQEIIQSLPDSIRKKVDLDAAGELYFKASAKGIWNHTRYPHITADFGIKNGEFTRNSITMSDVVLKGHYDNGKENKMQSSILTINPISVRIENENISGKIKMKNFVSPKGIAEFSASVNLQKMNRFLKLEDLSDEEGMVKTVFKTEFQIDTSKGHNNNKLKFIKVLGKIELIDAGFRWTDYSKRFTGINGKIEIDQQTLLKDIRLKIANNDFTLNLKLDNLFEYINNTDTLYISGTSKSDYINYEELISALSSNDSKNSPFLLPDSIVMDCNLNVNSFKRENLICSSVSGHMTYTPFNLTFHSVAFNAIDGSVTGDMSFSQNEAKDLSLKVQANLTKIDISKLFDSFNNFGQSVLQDKHLKGHVSGDVRFNSLWNKNLVVYEDKIECYSDIEIVNGELIDFKPLLALSKYIDVKELKHITFATLKNSIYIKNKVVNIPRMDVLSNAIDINISGTHNFDNSYEYHIVLALSDVLWGKAKNKRSDIDEYKEEESGGKTKLPLTITGKDDEYKVGYDRKRAREDFSEKMTTEKKDLKTILHKEYGWFNKDTTIKVIPVRPKKKIEINWDDNEKADVPADTVVKQENNNANSSTTTPMNKPKMEWEDK
jgi:hypothetical protein